MRGEEGREGVIGKGMEEEGERERKMGKGLTSCPRSFHPVIAMPSCPFTNCVGSCVRIVLTTRSGDALWTRT